MSVLLLGVLGMPFLAAATAGVATRAGMRAALLARAAASLVGVALAGVAGMWVVVFVAGPLLVRVGPVVLVADRMAVVLLALVVALSGVIQVFACRYLSGDPRQSWWVVATSLLTGSTGALVCAGTISLFALAWIAAGASLVLLLATYPGAPGARSGVVRAAISFAIGDAGLIAGVGILDTVAGHDVRFDGLRSAVAEVSHSWAIAVGALLVLGALARSSQIPFHRWLPFTLAAPTPVSALMHAGLINAGAILVIRFAGVITDQRVLMEVLFTVGVVTLVYASAARMVKADVKGRLVFSTMAQMGYMIMGCGLGAFPAVLLHLVAHSLFKSALFLGSGRGVRAHANARDWPAEPSPSRSHTSGAIALAIIVSSGSFALAIAAISPNPEPQNLAPFAFAAVSLAVAAGQWVLARRTPSAVVVAVFGSLVSSFGYTALLDWFTTVVPVPELIDPVPAALVAIPIAALTVLQILARPRQSNRGLAALLYSITLTTALPRPMIRKGFAP